MYDQLIHVVNEISYLGITLESTRGWNRHKMKQMVKVNLSFVDKCLTRTPDMRIQLLENVYEMVREARLMYGAETWGLDEGRKEIDIIHGRVCKKILGIPRFAATVVAVLELGRDSRRGKVLCLAVQRTLQMGKEELERVCYEWQVNNLEFDSWATKLSKQLSKIGLGYIWQDLRVNRVRGICKKN
jgi:hypothetical protein